MGRKLGADKEDVSYGRDGFTRQHEVGKPPFSYPALKVGTQGLTIKFTNSS